MAVTEIVGAMRENVAAVVFVNVLLQQRGLPVPVVPTLLLAGSLAAGTAALGASFIVAVVASVLADGLSTNSANGSYDRTLHCPTKSVGDRLQRVHQPLGPKSADGGFGSGQDGRLPKLIAEKRPLEFRLPEAAARH